MSIVKARVEGKKIDLANLVISPIYFLSYDLLNLLLHLFQASSDSIVPKAKAL